MTPQEIGRITELAAMVGISRVKLTGGEPLMRADIAEIVERIARIRDVSDLAMTTNGTLLAERAADLKKAGLVRVNVSFLSLNARTYNKVTGGSLDELLKGVEAAVDVGLHPVKLNTVILHGVNDGEVERLIEFAARMGTPLQIIELEPVNVDSDYYCRFHHPLKDIEEGLMEKAMRIEVRPTMNQRRVYHLPKTKVEVVNPLENTEFCAHCTRLRLTSDGKLKPCLMRDNNLVDILTPLRIGATDKGLLKVFFEAIKRRAPYYRPNSPR